MAKPSEQEIEFFEMVSQSRQFENQERKQEKSKSKNLEPPKFDTLSDILRLGQDVGRGTEQGALGLLEGFGGLPRSFVDFGNLVKSGTQVLPNAIASLFGEEIPQQEPATFGLPSTQEIQKQVESFDPRLAPQGPVEEITRRGGQIAPNLIGGGTTLPEKGVRALVSSAAGKGAKELGLGDTGQAIFEILGQVTPTSLSKNIIGKNPQQQSNIDFLRNKGLSEKEIAPLIIEDDFGSKVLQFFSSKGKKTQGAIKDSKGALDLVFDSLKNSPNAEIKLTGQQSGKVTNNLTKTLSKLEQSEAKRNALVDVKDFIGSNQTTQDVIDLYRKIGKIFKGDVSVGQKLKTSLSSVLKEVSPELSSEFERLNKIYSNFAKVRQNLAPETVDSLLKSPKTAVKLVTSAIYGLGGAATSLATAGITSKASRELLINPKFKNLGTKFTAALKNESPKLMRSVLDSFANSIDDEELKKEIKSLKPEDFF